jgi:hypothetical protein
VRCVRPARTLNLTPSAAHIQADPRSALPGCRVRPVIQRLRPRANGLVSGLERSCLHNLVPRTALGRADLSRSASGHSRSSRSLAKDTRASRPPPGRNEWQNRVRKYRRANFDDKTWPPLCHFKRPAQLRAVGAGRDSCHRTTREHSRSELTNEATRRFLCHQHANWHVATFTEGGHQRAGRLRA